MQNESVAQSQFPRFEQNVERIPDTWDATRAPDLVCMNTHAIWASWRNIVLVVMMGEVDVVHANPPDACISYATGSGDWMAPPGDMHLHPA